MSAPSSQFRICMLVVTSVAGWLHFGVADKAFAARLAGVFPTAIDRLCFPTEIFVGEILNASPADCQLKDPSVLPWDPTALTCDPKNDLKLRIRIDEPIGANGEALKELNVRPIQPNDVIEVFVKVYNHRQTEVGDESPPKDEFGLLRIDPPTGEPLSAQQISDRFVGQKFIFGIRPNPFDKAHIPTAIVWIMELRQWVEENLRNSAGACSRLIEKDRRP